MTTLLFHIGDPKTGTSSIQTVLHQRLWSSPDRTLAYPDVWKDRGLVSALRSEDEGEWVDSFADRARWLADVDADLAVISAETMAKADPRALQAALERHLPSYADSARVVAYVRPHAQRVLSAYAQQAKSGLSVKSLDRFHLETVERRSFFYTSRFSRWRDVFGDRFVLRPMSRDLLFQRDVVADFLNVALEGARFTITGSVDANTSLSVRQLAAMREVQIVLRDAGVQSKLRVFVGGELARVLNELAAAPGEKVQMHRDLVLRTRDTYLEDAQAMDALFFDAFRNEGGVGPMESAFDQALANAVPTPQSHALSDHIGETQLAGFRRNAQALADLLDAAGPGWKKAQLRRRGHIAESKGRGGRNEETVARVQGRFEEVCKAVDEIAKAEIVAA